MKSQNNEETDPGRQPPELPEVVAGTRFRRKEGLTNDNEGTVEDSPPDRSGERTEAEGMEGGQGGMTQAYKEYRKAMMVRYPYVVSRFYDGKWRYSSRTDSPEKYVDWYKKTYGNEPKDTRITDSSTRKVVWQG